MANNPKKMTDPTEAALSAIQEALNVHEEDEQPAAPAAATPDLFTPAGDQVAEAVAAAAQSQKPTTGDVADIAGRAANDDQQSIGQILHALQRRPARSSYFVAALFSGAWIVGCLGLSLAYLSDLHAALGAGRSPLALAVGLGAAALLPIIFFFGVAHMAWRAQELRLIAQSMARVAMRLAEPEGVARDSIVTVG
ncbi:MAG: methyl-accepting chemotaxis protein, partial [Xanthobacteraceae bacterium]